MPWSHPLRRGRQWSDGGSPNGSPTCSGLFHVLRRGRQPPARWFLISGMDVLSDLHKHAADHEGQRSTCPWLDHCSRRRARESPADERGSRGGEREAHDHDRLPELRGLLRAPGRCGDVAGEQRREDRAGDGDADAGGDLGGGVDEGRSRPNSSGPWPKSWTRPSLRGGRDVARRLLHRRLRHGDGGDRAPPHRRRAVRRRGGRPSRRLRAGVRRPPRRSPGRHP